MDKHRHFFLSKEDVEEIKRPSKYIVTDEIKDHAYDVIANGGSIRVIAEYYNVSRQAVHKWLVGDMDRYNAAREARSALRVEDMFNSMEDLIDGKIDPQVYHQIKDTIKWTTGKESHTYSEKKSTELDYKGQTYEDILNVDVDKYGR